MTMRTVYLAGPIAGCDRGEANDWRAVVASELAAYDIKGISPLRCEPVVGERYALNYADPKFGTARAIGSKNLFDVRSCDMTLVYLPKAINDRRPSYGTILELGWAHALGKATVVVTDDPYLQEHPVIGACAGWILSTLDEAVEVITGILGDYARRV